MRKLLLVILAVLASCTTPTAGTELKRSYRVFCATAAGQEMISGHFSQVEILDGGALSLVAADGRRVIVTGFCLALEVR